MEANQVPYAIKICSKMDPERLEVQNRTRALWKKRKSAVGSADEADLPALGDAAGSAAAAAEDEAGEDGPPLMDAPPDDAVASEAMDLPPVQDAQEYVIPESFSSDDEALDGAVASSSREEPLETVHERFDRLSRLYGHGAALMLCGAVQEGVHYDPHEGRWKTLDGFVCPYEPVSGSSGAHDEMPVVAEALSTEAPSSGVAAGGGCLDDPIFGEITVSSGVAETPERAVEDSHAGHVHLLSILCFSVRCSRTCVLLNVNMC